MALLGLFIFFLALLAFYRKKSTRYQQDITEAFWERETKANSSRRQDISGLPYITIPLDKFPIGICTNDQILSCESTLLMLSERKILNLGTQTNTDLKLKYGPANLNVLSECEQHFMLLCRTLISYAKTLAELGYEEEAITVLEFAIRCGSDASKNYLLLAEIYLRRGRDHDANELLEQAKQLDSLMKDSIVVKLSGMLSS